MKGDVQGKGAIGCPSRVFLFCSVLGLTIVGSWRRPSTALANTSLHSLSKGSSTLMPWASYSGGLLALQAGAHALSTWCLVRLSQRLGRRRRRHWALLVRRETSPSPSLPCSFHPFLLSVGTLGAHHASDLFLTATPRMQTLHLT